MRLRAKFLLFAGLIVLGTAGPMAGLSYLLQKRLVERDLYHAQAVTKDQRLKAARFASSCRLLLGDRPRLLAQLERMMEDDPDLLYAYYADDKDRLLLHSDSSLEGFSVAQWEKRRPPDAVETAVRVPLPDRPEGRAVLGFSDRLQSSRRWELEQVLRRTLRRAAALSAAALAVGLTAALALTWRLTRPVEELLKASKQVARGDFDVRLRDGGGDELGALARRFAEMAQSLAKLDELKDDFIAAVTHDLRGPLAAVNMHARHLLHEDPDRGKLTDYQRRALGVVEESSTRLGVFVTNLLDAAKIKAGRMEYRLQDVALPPLLRGLEALFGILARHRGLELVCEVPEDIPPVRADPERLEHVLANLLTNALKFTSTGRVALKARRADGGVSIEVRDTGKGIPAEDLPRLFQRYRQFGAPERKEDIAHGTGLGLYIVKQSVDAMGAKIEADSKPGEGTTFTVWLPESPPSAPGGA